MPAPATAPLMIAGPMATEPIPYKAIYPRLAATPVAGQAAVFSTVFNALPNLFHFDSLPPSECPHLSCPPSLSFHFSPVSWLSPFLCSGVSGIRPQ